jgi:agmatine deiminase
MPHFPPEWSPHDAVWIGFPSAPDLWLDDLDGAQEQVAAFARAVHADGRGEAVRLICATEAAAERAVALKTGAAIHIMPFFDIWLRDTGPLVLARDGLRIAVDYRGNGWGGKYPSPLDDALGALLAASIPLPHEPRHMILEGGAIDVDGAGLLVTTEQCLLNPNRNPYMSKDDIEAELKLGLGIDRILWLGEGLIGDHTDGHVDNLARFVAPGVLALPEPDGPDDPNADIYADAWARAEAFGIELVPIPSPGRVEIDGEVAAASYMNFYIGNAAVVVPAHGSANDASAVNALKPLFPDRLVAGLPTDHILTGGGSFHCISQQVPTA